MADYARMKAAIDAQHQALVSAVSQWERIDLYAEAITTSPELKAPIDFRKDVERFEFVQRFDAEKAKEALDLIKSMM